MTLTAQMFEQIATLMRSDHRPISDRRRYPRVGVRARIHVVPLNERREPQMAREAWVRDVSGGGFGLMDANQLTQGQLFIARLDGHGTNPPLSMLCEVVNRYSNDRVGTRILRKLQSTSEIVKSETQELQPAS